MNQNEVQAKRQNSVSRPEREFYSSVLIYQMTGSKFLHLFEFLTFLYGCEICFLLSLFYNQNPFCFYLQSRSPILGSEILFSNRNILSFLFSIFSEEMFQGSNWSKLCCFCTVAVPPKKIGRGSLFSQFA